jgi:molecular chaperone DnaJ
MHKDYYEILGISKGASVREIKSAYKRLAKQYHPDVNPVCTAAHERFKEIGEAYEVLSDARKRRAYDTTGASVFSRGEDGGHQGGGDGFDQGEFMYAVMQEMLKRYPNGFPGKKK